MSKGHDSLPTVPFKAQSKTGALYSYVTARPGQRSEALTFSPLCSEELELYRLRDNRFSFRRETGRRAPSRFSAIRAYKCRPCTESNAAVKFPSMKIGRRRGQFGTPPEDLPCRSDQVCCSSWRTAGEFVEQSELPIERFDWSREINQDTGEWLIHGEVHPTLREKLIGKWLWLKTKLRLARCALGGERWRT